MTELTLIKNRLSERIDKYRDRLRMKIDDPALSEQNDRLEMKLGRLAFLELFRSPIVSHPPSFVPPSPWECPLCGELCNATLQSATVMVCEHMYAPVCDDCKKCGGVSNE